MENIYELNTPKIAAETLDNEVMVIDFEAGLYFSLRESAAAIWTLVTAHHSLEKTLEQLQPVLPNAEKLVPDFITQLEQHNLIRLSQMERQTVNIAIFGDNLKPPVLEKFDDMQALLLLDPIHEVAPRAGWPFKK